MSVYPARKMSIAFGTTDKASHVKPVSPQTKTSVYEQTFLAPGTWTWPGICTTVQVLIVSGGGGGATSLTTPAPVSVEAAVYAGGGGVGVFEVPVSAPVPVTVGAGGLAPVTTPTLPAVVPGASGGTSSFGPITPPVPFQTAYIEGGLGAGQVAPLHPYPVGGGAQSNLNAPSPGIPTFNNRTLYSQGGTGSGQWGGSAGDADPLDPVGNVKFSYGAGARLVPSGYGSYGRGMVNTGYNLVTTVSANTGHGGQSGGAFAPGIPIVISSQGLDGSSGIVIVRWVE